MTAETGASAAGNAEGKTYTGALVVLTSLFFMWGLITSLNDILIPHLKAAFELTYVQVMLIQFCFFGAYFVTSLPWGVFVERAGYKTGIVVGLLIAAFGCVMFYPAASTRSYPFFLGALFVLAAGITLLQVAANPYVAILGPERTASSRLNLTQAFNSLGTTIGPRLGTYLILAAPVAGAGAAAAAEQAHVVQGPYLGLAATLCVIAVLIGLVHLPKIEAPKPDASAGGLLEDGRSIWSHRPLALGAVAIFVYVGAEVSIGSVLVNFLELPQIAGLTAVAAGGWLSWYWGGAMVGRFIGSFVLRYMRPGTLLAFNALANVVLLALAMIFAGRTAMWTVIAIGLFNSIMFPTIFTLAIDGLGKRTGEGSGILCMAIVGGAIVPVIMGWMADHAGLLYSLALPLVCYLYIAYYGRKGHIPVAHPVQAQSSA
ncbi:MAG TPA: sugar MFS transporter [Steroidobacteraceae bacterium]|nr:sugar MFS transporter [Steroidobacteraceae bacterium]